MLSGVSSARSSISAAEALRKTPGLGDACWSCGFWSRSAMSSTGPAMTRRATYMYGTLVDCGPQGQVGCGLGQRTSTGQVAVIDPTIVVTETGEKHTIDGVEIEFQMAPGTARCGVNSIC